MRAGARHERLAGSAPRTPTESAFQFEMGSAGVLQLADTISPPSTNIVRPPPEYSVVDFYDGSFLFMIKSVSIEPVNPHGFTTLEKADRRPGRRPRPARAGSGPRPTPLSSSRAKTLPCAW